MFRGIFGGVISGLLLGVVAKSVDATFSTSCKCFLCVFFTDRLGKSVI